MRTMRRGLAATVVLGALIAPASAQSAPSALSCHIEGTADADVNLVGGSGTYHFTDFLATCYGTDANGMLETRQLDITSDGTFKSTACGTGQAADPHPSVSGLGVPGGWGYVIDFFAGQGVLRWTDPAVIGGGDVRIVPDPAQPSPAPPPGGQGCVGGFLVSADVWRVGL